MQQAVHTSLNSRPPGHRAPMRRLCAVRASLKEAIGDKLRQVFPVVKDDDLGVLNNDLRQGEKGAKTDVGLVTWPSYRVTRLWKFFFNPGKGYTDRYGIAIPIGPLDKRTNEQRAEARAQAARQVVNIDGEERSRRIKGGSLLLVITAAVAAWMVQSHAGPLQRLAVMPIFFLGAAEIASGVTGMWSIALASVWDVDGTGMQTVPDPELDLKLRKKVLSFVGAGAIATLFVTAVWVSIPL